MVPHYYEVQRVALTPQRIRARLDEGAVNSRDVSKWGESPAVGGGRGQPPTTTVDYTLPPQSRAERGGGAGEPRPATTTPHRSYPLQQPLQVDEDGRWARSYDMRPGESLLGKQPQENGATSRYPSSRYYGAAADAAARPAAMSDFDNFDRAVGYDPKGRTSIPSRNTAPVPHRSSYGTMGREEPSAFSEDSYSYEQQTERDRRRAHRRPVEHEAPAAAAAEERPRESSKSRSHRHHRGEDEPHQQQRHVVDTPSVDPHQQHRSSKHSHRESSRPRAAQHRYQHGDDLVEVQSPEQYVVPSTNSNRAAGGGNHLIVDIEQVTPSRSRRSRRHEGETEEEYRARRREERHRKHGSSTSYM